jgi:hypothetical protein
MVLPTGLVSFTPAEHVAYHNEIHAGLPGLALPTGLTTATISGHLNHHDVLHAHVGNLPDVSLNDSNHIAHHNTVHAYVNAQTVVFDNEYHVSATTGNDGNSGAALAPLATIGAAITKMATDNTANETARVSIGNTTFGSGGTFREQLTVNSGGTTKAMQFRGKAGGTPVISASDAISSGSWTVHDAPNRIYRMTWTNNWGVSAYPSGWEGFVSSDPILRRREIVVINGVWVRQVLTLAEMTNYDSSYFVDEATDRLYVRLPTGGNITTDLIEVGMRDYCLQATSRTNLTLRGLTFQHAVSSIQQSGVRLVGCTNPLLEDNTFKGCNWSGISFDGTGLISRRCHYDDNGVMGYSSFRAINHLHEDGSCNRNNLTRGAWASYKNWEDGCKYLAARNITMRRFEWRDNGAPGCWFDHDNKDILVEDSVMEGNTGNGGVWLEFSQGPFTFRRNKITGNFRGFNSQNLANVTLEDNEIWDNVGAGGIEVGSRNTLGAGSTVTEWDTSNVVSIDPAGWTLRRNLIWASSAGGGGYLVYYGNFPTVGEWQAFRDTYTGLDNEFYSQTNTAIPFVCNSPDEYMNHATYLSRINAAGSREVNSTFSSSAPSPPPTL